MKPSSFVRAVLFLVCGALPLAAQQGDAKAFSADALRFFENEVRPLLSTKCAACHNDKLLTSGLSVESRESILMGGNRGQAAVSGFPRRQSPDPRYSPKRRAQNASRRQAGSRGTCRSCPLDRVGTSVAHCNPCEATHGRVVDALVFSTDSPSPPSGRFPGVVGAQSDRPFHPGAYREQGFDALTGSRAGHLDPAVVYRSGRPAAGAGRSRCFRERRPS